VFGLERNLFFRVQPDPESEYYELGEYSSNIPRWCPGCGDFGILTAIQKLCHEEQLPPEKTVFASGIGCSSRFPHYMKTYGFHGLHGRAFPVAEGIKVHRPDLHVFVNTGDGDCCSIGAMHWIHAIRYNIDMVAILHDNNIYGLTKAQTSPTSPVGLKSNTNPRGGVLNPLNPMCATMGLGKDTASFVAQVVDWMPDLLYQVIREAYRHKGFSFVRVMQRCPKYTAGVFASALAHPEKEVLLLEDVYGRIKISDSMKKMVKNVLKHDFRDIHTAREVSTCSERYPVGILYCNENIQSYGELKRPKVKNTPARIRSVMEKEFDKVTKKKRGKAAPGAPQMTINGNTAVGMGIISSGMEICSFHPIDPAIPAMSYLSEVFETVGGIMHQAEDPIAALGFAIGASYSGTCAVTITSGPGFALMTEFLALACMTEIPVVIVNVQRSGPSSGLNTKAEQGDLLTAVFGAPGDAPKIVIAPSSPKELFFSIITSRKLAEEFRMPVIILSDANLAKKREAFDRLEFKDEWVASPIDQTPVPEKTKPYDWDPKTGLSKRFIPGQPNGMHALTGLAHSRNSKVAYESGTNQDACNHRSLKLATLRKTLKTPTVLGDPGGDLLLVTWGSLKNEAQTAVMSARKAGIKVSSLHLTYLNPLPPGLKSILKNFKKVATLEINYSDSLDDELINEGNRRYGDLAWLLRAKYLVDVDSWTSTDAAIFKAKSIEKMIRDRMKK